MLKKIRRHLLKNKIELGLLLIILAAGAFLRIWRIADYMTFLGDEGRDVLVVKRMLVDHRFTLLGPTASVGGFFLGPIYYYFMLPFLWLWRLDPVGPAMMVAIFGVATIFLVYRLGKEFFNIHTGLIAAFLYAISPLVIAYSRSSWNPNLMPFFSSLTLLTFYKAVTKNSKPLFFLGGVFLGITVQLHYLAVFLGIIVAVYLITIKIRALKLLIKHSLLSILGFILGFSPFLLFEVRHDFPNLQAIFNFILGSGGETGFVGVSFLGLIDTLIFRLFWRLLTRFPPISQITISESLTSQLWYWGMVILVLASLALFFLDFLKALKKKSADIPKFTLLFLWLFLGVSLFTFYRKEIYDYYLGFMFPLPFLFASNLLVRIAKYKKTIIISLIALAFLTLNSLEGIPFRFAPNRQMEQTKTISRFIYEKTEGKPFNFALITGQNSDHAYRYFLESWGAKPVTIENLQVDPDRKTVTDQLLVVCEVPCQPLGNSLWEVAGFGRAEIAGEWQVSVAKVYKLVRYKE